MEKIYSDNDVVSRYVSFGVAICYLKMGNRVTRAIWGGYWKLEKIEGITQPIILAHLKDGKSKVAATPYQEDMLADDWIILTP